MMRLSSGLSVALFYTPRPDGKPCRHVKVDAEKF